MRFFALILLVYISGLKTFSQAERKVAILNMSTKNGDSGLSRTLSSIRMMTLAGIPFDTTSSLIAALNYPIIVTGTRIQQGALTPSEISDLENWVSNGGVLLTSNLREPLLYNLCGVSASTSNAELYELTWDTVTNPMYFDLVDDSLEVTVSLGRPASGPNFVTKYYNLSTGSALAHYEDGTAAMVKNSFGNGYVYSLGPDFRDVFFRNRINADVNAQRTYSNGFEPTTDVFVFVIRNIIRNHIPNTVYKYTVPYNYSSVVMITHDVDSKTSYDTMANFAMSEKNRGINAQYNLTTNYYSNGWISDLYIGTSAQVEFVQNLGHTLASHSVGHFPDFAIDSLFPYGTLGNDSSNYHPTYSNGYSSNGTVLGEVEISKNLIDTDFNVDIKSWRSGHLQYPDSLNMALETLGYEFNSTYSANNVLTGFPFYATKIQSFSSEESTILEIPMTLSDVFMSTPMSIQNYMYKVKEWVDATRKYDQNNASTVLLIHPNRNYKLIAQESYLDSLPETMKPMAFEDFGRFWRKRDSLVYHTILQDDTLFVLMDSDYTNSLSFVIDTIALDSIVFLDKNGLPLHMNSQPFGNSQKLYFQEDPNVAASIFEYYQPIHYTIYPNPTRDVLNVSIQGNYDDLELIIFSIHGQQIAKIDNLTQNFYTLNLSELNLKTGTYFIQLRSPDKISNKRFIFIHK
jgi:hypothetical protein